jgi:phospholipase D1/2
MDFFNKIKEHLDERVDDIKGKVDNVFGGDSQEDKPSNRPDNTPAPAQQGTSGPETAVNTDNRFASFAPQSSGQAKWYVDGASYFWAVSIALERKCI